MGTPLSEEGRLQYGCQCSARLTLASHASLVHGEVVKVGGREEARRRIAPQVPCTMAPPRHLALVRRLHERGRLADRAPRARMTALLTHGSHAALLTHAVPMLRHVASRAHHTGRHRRRLAQRAVSPHEAGNGVVVVEVVARVVRMVVVEVVVMGVVGVHPLELVMVVVHPVLLRGHVGL